MSQTPSERDLPPDTELNRDAVKMIEANPEATMPELMVMFALRWVKDQRERADKAEDACTMALNSAKFRGEKIKNLEVELEAVRGTIAKVTEHLSSRETLEARVELETANIRIAEQNKILFAIACSMDRTEADLWAGLPERVTDYIQSLRERVEKAETESKERVAQQVQALEFLKQIARKGDPIWDVPHNGKPFFYDGYRKVNTGFISEVRAFFRSMGVSFEEEE